MRSSVAKRSFGAGARCHATRSRTRSYGNRSTRGGGTRPWLRRTAPRIPGHADPWSRRRRGTAAPSRGCAARAAASSRASPRCAPCPRSSPAGRVLGHALAREPAQPAQRDLDVARVELDVAVEVAKRALVPDLDRAARAAAVLPDPDALRVVAVCAEGTRAAGADPLRPALVPLALLGQPLLQRLRSSLSADPPALPPASCPRRTSSAGTPA